MEPTIKRIWQGDGWGGVQSIRMDWSNDRHYEVVIQKPCNAENVAAALMTMAAMIERDPLLK